MSALAVITLRLAVECIMKYADFVTGRTMDKMTTMRTR